MRNPFDSQKSARAFADAAARKLGIPFQAMLEAVAAGMDQRDWNTMSAALPRGASRKGAAGAGQQAGQPASSSADLELPLADWRVASMGPEEAQAEVGQAHLQPWTMTIRGLESGDGLSVDLADPMTKTGELDPLEAWLIAGLADPMTKTGPDMDEDEADRSMWIGLELDRSVPKLLVARAGGDNIAQIWATPTAIYVESNHDDKVVVVDDQGGVSIRRSGDVDFGALGERAPQAWQIVNADGRNIHGEEDDPFGLNSFDLLTGAAVETARRWVEGNPGYAVVPVKPGDVQDPGYVDQLPAASTDLSKPDHVV